jgi:hypothetical protein
MIRERKSNRRSIQSPADFILSDSKQKSCSSDLHRSPLLRYLLYNHPLGFSFVCLAAAFVNRMYRQRTSMPFGVMEEDDHPGAKSLQLFLMIDQDCKFNPQETNEE